MSESASQTQHYLSSDDLNKLTVAWELWAKDPVSILRKIARSRLHLLFLLIRYGGLRLAEAFNLDVCAAIDTQSGMLKVGGKHSRQIILPMPPMRHIRLILALEEAHKPYFLRLDPGFCRHTFYSVAKRMEIPVRFAGPRAVRIARKHELLGLHMPPRLVDEYLGLDSPRKGVDSCINFFW